FYPAPGRIHNRGRASADQAGFLELADLVAQARGVLELQVAGVLVHALLQLLDLRHGLGRVQGRVVGSRLGDLAGLAAPLALALGLARLGAGPLHDVHDLADDLARDDAVLGVVLLLLFAAAVGLLDRRLHRAGDRIGVQDRPAAQVAGG